MIISLFCSFQLFMFLLWILLQLAVVFMYWDLPPTEKKKVYIKHNGEEYVHGFGDEEDEVEEEVKPLMTSQELVGSYGSVMTSSLCKNHRSAASNNSLNQIHSPLESPAAANRRLRNSSSCQGNW